MMKPQQPETLVTDNFVLDEVVFPLKKQVYSTVCGCYWIQRTWIVSGG